MGAFFREQELEMERRIHLTGDDHRDFLIYLDEADKRLKLLDRMFREEGFTDRFEWEMNYLFIVSLQMFMLMVCRIFQGTRQTEDEYTNSGKPVDYVVKNVNRETRRWLKDLRKTMDYTYRSIKEKDKGRIKNGAISFGLIAMVSGSIIDKKHGRQFCWPEGEKPDWLE